MVSYSPSRPQATQRCAVMRSYHTPSTGAEIQISEHPRRRLAVEEIPYLHIFFTNPSRKTNAQAVDAIIRVFGGTPAPPLTGSYFFHESRSATVRLNTGFDPG